MRRPLGLATLATLLSAHAAAGQSSDAPTPVTRADIVATALGATPRLALARADTAVAFAQLLAARAYQNPTLSASYSKATPRYHVVAELPVDVPGVRGARVRAAEAGRDAARVRFAFARAAIALAADTAYTRALAARERLRLSLRNARAADSLHGIAERRRDAGDASDLDVELAAVNAGQQANAAATDSLAYLSALLDVQAAAGLAADRVAVVPVDSLVPPPLDSAAPAGAPLGIVAARASLESARLAARVARRSVWGAPSLVAGFETGDPTGDERGVLPTVGVALPLPLLSRGRAPIAQAEAERERARAELALAEVESRTEVARARRALAIALDKVRRDRMLVAAADRVAAKSLTAYREGAASLPNVLEAQRSARDGLARYVDDVADAWIAAATLRVLTLTPDR